MKDEPSVGRGKVVAVVSGGADDPAIDKAAEAAELNEAERDFLRALINCGPKDSTVLVERVRKK